MSDDQKIILQSKFNLGDYTMKSNSDFSEVRTVMQKIPVRKPHSQEFLMVHHDGNYTLTVGLLKTQEEGEFYLVNPKLIGQVPDLALYKLVLSINRQGQLFVWPLRLPPADRAPNSWHISALEAAEFAKLRWTKVVSRQTARAYEAQHAVADLPMPSWPDKSFGEILEIAFKNNIINESNHFLLQQLRGEV